MPEHSYSLAILFKMAMAALSVYKVASIIETHVHDQQAVLLMQLLKDPDSLLSHGSSSPQRVSSCQQLHVKWKLIEMHIITLHLRSTASEAMENRPRSLCLHNSPGDSNAQSSLENRYCPAS